MNRVLFLGARSLGAIAAAGCLLASPAAATTVMFQGLGLFSNTAPTTATVAPGESFTFAFNLDDAAPAVSTPSGSLFTAGLSDFTYTLDNVVQAVSLQSVDFTADGFVLQFGDSTELDFVGDDIGSDGTVALSSMGAYSVFVRTKPHAVPSLVASFAAPASGASNLQLVGSATVVTTIAAVPEPASWALLIVGFAGAGAVLRQRRRRVALA